MSVGMELKLTSSHAVITNSEAVILKRVVSRSRAAHLAELTSNLGIWVGTVTVILDCDPKSLNSS